MIDTTVLVSAFLSESGVSAQLLQSGEDGHLLLVTAPEILDEMERVLLKNRTMRSRYPYEDSKVREYRSRLEQAALVVENAPQMTGVVRVRTMI